MSETYLDREVILLRRWLAESLRPGPVKPLPPIPRFVVIALGAVAISSASLEQLEPLVQLFTIFHPRAKRNDDIHFLIALDALNRSVDSLRKQREGSDGQYPTGGD
jgi:hypothetical protein